MNKKIKKIIVMAACAALACVTLGGCSIKDEANNWLDQILCDHEYDEGEVTKEATCANKGEITYTCEECGKTKTEKTDKLPHVEKEIEVAATCQETGLTEGVKCVVCEEILVYPKVVAKIAHTEIITSAELAATCTTAGQTKGSYCGVCNEVLSISEGIPALGHVDNDSNDKCDTCGFSSVLQLDDIEVGTDLTGYKFRLKVSEDEFKQYVFSEEYKENSLIIRFNPDTSLGESSGACDNRIYNNKEDGIMLIAWYDVFNVFLYLPGCYDEELFDVTKSDPIPAGLGPVIEIETGDWSRYVELYYVG